jgi:hypothetical protein
MTSALNTNGSTVSAVEPSLTGGEGYAAATN